MNFQSSDVLVKSFAEMGFDAQLMNFLKHKGVVKPTEVQMRAIPLALEGKDLVAIAQTGSGKTYGFVIPILENIKKKPESRAIIFVPSREMAQQIYKVFMDLSLLTGLEPCLVIGGVPNDKQVSALRKHPAVIIATPGRMNDHLITNKLLLKGTEIVVFDEADRMLDMGFAPQLESIRKTLRGHRQTLMFSASFNSGVEKMAEGFFLQEPYLLRSQKAEAPVAQLRQRLLFVNKNEKNEILRRELQNLKKSVIIFAADQSRCEFVDQYLKDNGVASDSVHGGMTQGHRNRVVREFREGKNRILVTTDLLARGLDVEQVGAVINFDFPFQTEDFLHRIGRTARAGRTGQAITFVTPLDSEHFERVQPYIVGAEEVKVDPNFKFKVSKPRGE